VEFGIATLPTDRGIRPDALARAAEERGFESLWFGDHSHIPASRATPWPGGAELPEAYYRLLSPVVALASAAAATRHLLLGTGVLLAAQRDPFHTAKELATLDLLSGGRLLVGVGAGWNAEEMRNHGTDPATRGRLLEERVQAVTALWTQERAAFHGSLVEFDEVFTWPKPVQQPRPPIHVGGAFPVALDRALRIGDGWMPMANRGDTDFAAHLRELPARAEKAGRPVQGFEVSIYNAPRDAGALERLQALGVHRALFVVAAAEEDRTLRFLDGLARLVDEVSP
jgi:probable F420-dependent oxidoreductase